MGHFPLGVEPKPLNGRVLVRVIGSNDRTASGLYIPETAGSRPVQGRVEEVSPGYYEEGVFREHQVHIGDIVVFPYNTGFDLILDNIEYRFVHEKDIVGILQGVNYGEETI